MGGWDSDVRSAIAASTIPCDSPRSWTDPWAAAARGLPVAVTKATDHPDSTDPSPRWDDDRIRTELRSAAVHEGYVSVIRDLLGRSNDLWRSTCCDSGCDPCIQTLARVVDAVRQSPTPSRSPAGASPDDLSDSPVGPGGSPD